MRRGKKAYLTWQARAYVKATKQRVNLILKERQISHATLAVMTGIPDSTMSRWLNEDRDEFMGLGDAALICDRLGITIRDILPDAEWRHQSDQRWGELQFFLTIPLDHARWMITVYKGASVLFSRR